MASHRHRRDPQRSSMARWRVQNPTAKSARRSGNALVHEQQSGLATEDAPTLAKTDEVLDKFVDGIVKADDANDVLYAVEASHDYDPGPGLEKIRAPLLAINSADDLINPPELGILEHEIKRVPHGRAMD